MCKIFSAIFFTLMLSLNVRADDKPDWWMETEDTTSNTDSKETFLHETRLLCVAKGYKNATGQQPSDIFLAALAMRARVDGKLEDRSIRLTKTDEITYKGLDDLRKNYLSHVAQHMTLSGACVDSDISDKIDKLDYYNLTKVIDNPNSLLISEGEDKGKYDGEILDRLAEKTTDWNYKYLRDLFPLKSDGTIFTNLSYEQKMNLLRKSYAKTFKPNTGLSDSFKITPTNWKFVNCYNKIEANRNSKSGNILIKGEKGEVLREVEPGTICQSIRAACGYKDDAAFCNGIPNAEKLPATTTTPCQRKPKPCGSKNSESSGHR